MKKHILIADDDYGLRLILRALLDSKGYEVRCVSGGEAALDAYANARAAKWPYELIVTDLGMPYTNGFEVAAKIRGVGDSETPILFMTASNEEIGLNERAAELTPFQILYKPFELDEFVRRIECVLAQSETNCEPC
ncbi:MAG: response regulator [Armatimonadetes bacterium]|nr:response regulator [Armatimonadota bacterium]